MLALRVLTCAAALCATGGAVAAGGALPYRVKLEVTSGAERPPEALQLAFERQLLERLSSAGCFSAIVPAAAAPAAHDLLLRVTLAEFEEVTREDDSGLTTSGAERPPEMREVLAETSAVVSFEVLTADGGASVRQRRWTEQTSRMYFVSQEPREAAAADWIDTASRRTAKLACRGSAKAWAAEIERARAAGAGAR